MYAVIKTGGKQQRVKPGDVIEVERIHGVKAGDSITLTALLVVDDEGKTHVGKEAAKAQVKAKLLGEEKGDKVKVFKYRPKTGYARRQGHRQMQALVEIEEISMGRRSSSRKAAEAVEASAEAVEEAVAAPAPASDSVGEEPSAGGAAPAEALDAPVGEATPEEAVEGSGEEAGA
jgi:large subunit ribosomal protein L21